MKYLFVSLILFLSLTAYAIDVFKCDRATGQELNILFTLPDYVITATREHPALSQIKFTDTEIDNEVKTSADLPQFGRFINIPEGSIAQVTLESAIYDSIQTINFYEAEPDFNQKIRSINQKFLEIGETGICRNQIISPLCIKPFLYNPETGLTRVLKKANIHITFISSPLGKNFTVRPPSSKSWMNLTRDLVLNPISESSRSETTPGSYIFFYNSTSSLSTIQPLVDWKHRKGYEVHTVNILDIGSTTTAIKNYLQTAYNTWQNPPEYILLVGDATGTTSIPTYVNHFTGQPSQFDTVGDNDYTKLAGNDDYPDAYIGRLCFSSTTELNTMVNRILNYEKDLNLGTGNWFEKTLLVGDSRNSGTSTETTALYIKSLILDYNPNQAFTELYTGNYPSQISTAINQGVSAYYYRGFGDFSGFSIQNINSLVNGGKFPVITYITCFGGDYANVNIGGISQAETFMKIGTPSAPKGAIAVYAPSSETHTCFNNLLTGAFAYGLYKENNSNPGQAVLRSKLALIANYPSNPQNYTKQYLMANNLLGDPSTEIWLKTPHTMVASYPLTASPGTSSVLVTVRDNLNSPVSGAWVCLQKGEDEIFVSGYTDETGHVILAYSNATSGLCNITITRQHYIPLLNTITIGTTHANAEYRNLVVDAPFQAGTSTNFQIKVMNYSANTLTGLTGDVSSENPFVTIQTASSPYPAMNAGTEGISTVNYAIHIATDCPKGSILPMKLTIHDGAQTYVSSFSIQENGLLFLINTVQIGTSGNIINPGETKPLSLSIQNLSLWNGLQIHTRLRTPYTMINFPTDSQDISSIPAGTSYTTNIPYQIQIGTEAINGQIITLQLHMYTDSGWGQDIPFNIQVGQSTLNDPSGPDMYGYYCIESRDTGSAYTPAYQWIELDPTLAGTGTGLNFLDNDTTGSGVFSTISLPFSFKFYGQIYTHVTICSNGYIMPGSNGSVEWMNWSIPGPMVPKPIIAPFWDDLLTINGGNVFYQYRPELHALIIEWSRLKNCYNSSSIETFAAWIHDAPTDSTTSSDNTITFQYKTINNVDAGSYIGDYLTHGEYATVGIGDNTGSIGLQYTHSNLYPTSARPLANQTALRFISINPITVNPRPVISSISISDPAGNNNSQADFGETVTINLTIRNQGQDDLPASNLVLTTTDQYVTLLNANSTLPAISYYQDATPTQPLQIHVLGNVPNLHSIPLTMHILAGSKTYELQFSIVAHAPDLQLISASFSDNNNQYPEPGETVTLNLSLKNISAIAIAQTSVFPIFPTQWNILPANHVVNFTSGTVVPLSFQIQIPPNYPSGSICNYQVCAQSGSYSWSNTQELIVGIPDPLFSNNLDSLSVQNPLLTMQNVTIENAQYIHTQGKEAVFDAGSYNGSYLILPLLNGNDLQALNIKFNYMNLNEHCEYGCLYSFDQASWVTAWSDTAIVNTPTYMNISFPITLESWSLNICFYASPHAQIEFTPFILDDIFVGGIHHLPGYFQGHVTLDGGTGDITQVELMALPDQHSVHPDAQGNYILPAYEGIYPSVVAILPGYQWAQLDSVSVISTQHTMLNDLVLQYYQPILNLTDTISGNHVTLQWSLGRDISRKLIGRSIAPTSYRVHIKRNNLNFTDTTTDTQYTHVLFGSGNYEFYVVAEYSLEGQIIYRDTSNVINQAITSNNDPIMPVITQLSQNYPNPFMGKTMIHYDLAKPAQSFRLDIYNVKGEHIRTLDKGNKSAGTYSMEWDGKDTSGRETASGIYFFKMECDHQTWVKKAIMIH